MSLPLRSLLFSYLMALIAASSQARAGVVLDMNFEGATGSVPGNLSTTGMLGTPAIGTLSATGGFVSGTRRAWTSGSNRDANNITTMPDGSFNDVGTPAGNVLLATLAAPAAITGALGPGQTTTVDFDLASFGNNNQNNFKYAHIIGLSSSGQEVFQILYRAGSGAGTRDAFAREFGEDNTTFAGGVLASVDGTQILDNSGNANNSTNTGARPTGVLGINITIDEFGWNASAIPNGGSSVNTPATGLGIASGATDLAEIIFFSSQNAANGTQNNGLWIDNLVVNTDLEIIPEPSSAAVILALAAFGGLRRRR